MGHMGIDPDMIRYIPDIVRKNDNIYSYISNTPDMIGLVTENPVKELGVERLLFGTDSPELDIFFPLKKLNWQILALKIRKKS